MMRLRPTHRLPQWQSGMRACLRISSPCCLSMQPSSTSQVPIFPAISFSPHFGTGHNGLQSKPLPLPLLQRIAQMQRIAQRLVCTQHQNGADHTAANTREMIVNQAPLWGHPCAPYRHVRQEVTSGGAVRFANQHGQREAWTHLLRRLLTKANYEIHPILRAIS